MLPGYHVRDLVFAQPDGDYLHPERFSREFKRAQTRYNQENPDEPLPAISLHTLRHGWQLSPSRPACRCTGHQEVTGWR